MKYFFDCEFLEDGNTIELISIAVVCEDGREYYAVNEDMPLDRISENEWLVANVVPHLPLVFEAESYRYEFKSDQTICFPRQIKEDLIEFVTGDNIEFWAYYGDYDWVCMCRLFGRMIDLPKHWPKFAYDLRQWLNHKKLSGIRQPDEAPHHALYDARWGCGIHKTFSNDGGAGHTSASVAVVPESIEPGAGWQGHVPGGPV